MIDWQPIETAPKDGTLILVGQYNRSKHYFGDIAAVRHAKSGWRAEGTEEYLSDGWEPTHWMLPPAPPK